MSGSARSMRASGAAASATATRTTTTTHELRGAVRGADEGDRVRVFFSGYEKSDRGKGKRKPRYVESERFSYVVESDSGADVLVIANEDYTGVNPDYPHEVTAPKYAEAHVQAIEAGGASADVWDVDAQGVPHDLGVLSHYDAVLWYLGDNRITQDPEDELIQTPVRRTCRTSGSPSASST